MSDSQAYEEVTVRSEGVTVTKRFEADEFPVPAIAFEFTTERDETVSIRLVDKVPDGVAVEDLGFHPEYGSEYWTIDEDTISFERDIEPDSEYTTVYGIRATGTDDIEQFLTDPTIAEVDPPLPGDGEEVSDHTIPESGDIVGDIIGERDDDSSGEDEEDSDVEEVETLNLTDPNTPNEGSTGGDSDTETAAEDIEAGKVVSAMATEIRNNDVSVDDLRLIKRAFDHVADETDDETADETSDGSTDARVQKLQSDVADLRAYTDALEEFLDENGTAEQLIDDFEEQLDQFSSELEDLQSDLTANSTTIEDLDESVEDLRESVENLESEVPEEDLMGRIDDIESDLSTLREWREKIQQTFGG
jgi:polyhydroxyalkanoate synthesis regulator phasin